MNEVNLHIARARARQRAIERRQSIAKLFIAVIGMAVIAMLLVGMSRSDGEYIEDTVIVRAGTDTRTLWNIAVAYGPNDMSIDDYIAIIKKDNSLTSNTIYPGDVLTIRIYEEK